MAMQNGILLIDDDMGVREGVANLLSAVAPVCTAGSWSEARGVLERDAVGLVVTDLHLRSEDGAVELLASVRARCLPVILCTGAHASELAAAVETFRPDCVLHKPFDVDEMLSAARRLYRAVP